MSLFAGAFVLMLAAGVILVVGTVGYLSSIRLLWVSAGLSLAAIVVALASVVVPRR
ncbi:MAG: hypothetical protein AB1551_06760 [Actinomycetota bacterium]